MENASKHKNPYNITFKGREWDYIPMSFGIIDEFKNLFRLQQYFEMINKQRNHTEADRDHTLSRSKKVPDQSSSLPGVSFEDDYNIPFIKVIEWVKRSWDSISQEKNFLSWRKNVIVNFKNQWPASNRKVSEDARMLLSTLMSSLLTFNPQKSFEKLKEIMNYLNAAIPWEIDDLIGLANECSTISLNYISIDEIIGSCMLGSHYEEHEPMYMEEKLTAQLKHHQTLGVVHNHIL